MNVSNFHCISLFLLLFSRIRLRFRAGCGPTRPRGNQNCSTAISISGAEPARAVRISIAVSGWSFAK